MLKTLRDYLRLLIEYIRAVATAYNAIVTGVAITLIIVARAVSHGVDDWFKGRTDSFWWLLVLTAMLLAPFRAWAALRLALRVAGESKAQLILGAELILVRHGPTQPPAPISFDPATFKQNVLPKPGMRYDCEFRSSSPLDGKVVRLEFDGEILAGTSLCELQRWNASTLSLTQLDDDYPHQVFGISRVVGPSEVLALFRERKGYPKAHAGIDGAEVSVEIVDPKIRLIRLEIADLPPGDLRWGLLTDQ